MFAVLCSLCAAVKQDTAAIIVAGGKGLRFGGKVRKQYLLLKGRPIMWWSLRAFQNTRSVQGIVLVVPDGDLSRVRAQVGKWKFEKWLAVVSGGATRADSVRAGLSVMPDGVRYIAVHDAVRPLITPEVIERVIGAARKTGAALAACPSKDTVKLSNGNGCVHSTPRREIVWLAQTPQIFERRLLDKAHARGRYLNATDDAMLVERLGVQVKLVESPADNMKVTVPMDYFTAKEILNRRGDPRSRLVHRIGSNRIGRAGTRPALDR